MGVLDKLRDIGLAVWFMDSGKMVDKKIVLKTRIHREYNSVIEKYFNEVGMECSFDGKIVFTEEGSRRFLLTTSEYLEDFLKLV